MGQWSSWTPCSVSCGHADAGVQSRSRSKPLGLPLFGGAKCGHTKESASCRMATGKILKPCPVDCEVSEWTEWSTCSQTCGGGITTRTRQSLYAAQYLGKACPHMQEEKSCNVHSCEQPWCHRHHVTCHMEGVGSHAKVVINHHFIHQ